MNKIELLSPVGDFECLKAAVQSGANCVYFGGELFNARASANNFNDEELKQAIEYAKIRNVKTNLTLNILIKNDEFKDAIELAKKAYEYGIDAIIVQDLGLAKKLIELFPDLPIHASTQMTIHNLDGVLEAEKLGFKRVVLSRELSIDEIKYICDNSNIEIEVFVHGALCMCYSGQCLLSSMIGARSGNRGKCAQPCRLPYELVRKTAKNVNNTEFSAQNDNTVTLDKGHLLSPKDLCSLDLLPTLVNLGITCFKIEGRLKNPEYVSTVTRIYRKYIDLAQSDKPYIIEEKDRKDLLQVFNRGGFSTGYLDGEPNTEFVYKSKPNNMGLFLGTVHNFNDNKGYITFKLEDDISIGDSVSLEKEKGLYTISELMINNQNVPTAKKGDIVKIGRIKGHISVNDKIFKISSKELNNLTDEYLKDEKRKVKINCKIAIHKNEPISMNIYTDSNASELYRKIDFTITSDLVPIDSINSPITQERITDQINKLGGTPFEFNKIDVNLDDNLYVPSISKLNQLRRDCISKLEAILLDRIHRTSELDTSSFAINNSENEITSNKEFSILLNTLNQEFDYTQINNIDRIYIPLKFFMNEEFSDKIKEITKIAPTYIYMPSIMKDSVIDNLGSSIDSILESFNIKGFVISNISHVGILAKYTNKYEMIANYTMNTYNNSTINELKNLGISVVTLSPELDKLTLNSFNSSVKTEAIVYGNLPVMTTNYCLLSGSNYCLEKCKNNCGNSNQEYYLKDRMNMEFRIIPDSFTKTTTILNSKKTSISINEIAVNSVRLDFTNENINDIIDIINTFKNGEILEGKEFTNGNFKRFV
ncbi:MAG: DUF3656 domain-containing protein [Clostridia bacterium]|nr:DUF3656 domain-containing protein [Clostridia bacterium]